VAGEPRAKPAVVRTSPCGMCLAPKALSHASLGHRPRNPIIRVTNRWKRDSVQWWFWIPKIAIAEINVVPTMERMTSPVNRAFSASGFLGAVNPWGDAPG